MITAGITAAWASVPMLPGTGPHATAAGGPPSAVTLSGRRNVMVQHVIKLHGRVTPGGSRKVAIRVGGRKLHAHTRSDGSYRARWSASSSGVYIARTRVHGSSVRSHRVRIRALRPAQASYYGPGLYGGGLACGGTLTPSKLGVANQTLPCGAKVTLRYRGRMVTVPVIDRGPYAGNREYDLTAATRAKLGFPPMGTVLTTR